jgi:tubulin polyglutamylase TTLL6/13
MYQEGLARFATVIYSCPKETNLNNHYIHLTNYAINKNNKNFVSSDDPERDDIGHKRSFSYILRYLTEKFGQDKVDELMSQIKSLIIRTISTV